MRIRCLSTIDHPKEFLFTIEPDLNKSITIKKSNIFEIYQKSKQQTPREQPLQQSFNFTNLSKSGSKQSASPHRLYPEKCDVINVSPRKPLTQSQNAQKITVKGLNQSFNEVHLKRSLRNEGVGIVYCRQNYNKINNKGEGTGEIMLEEIKNVNLVKNKLRKYGLEVNEDTITHGVKHMISERFAKILQTEKSQNSKAQHNYFRA